MAESHYCPNHRGWINGAWRCYICLAALPEPGAEDTDEPRVAGGPDPDGPRDLHR